MGRQPIDTIVQLEMRRIQIQSHGVLKRRVWPWSGLLVSLVAVYPALGIGSYNGQQSGSSPLRMGQGWDAIDPNYRALEAEPSWSHPQPQKLSVREHEDLSVDNAFGGDDINAEKSRMTLMLDLDKTCLLGNDGNDLPICLQYAGKTTDMILDLYKRILNPNIRLCYEGFAAKGFSVDVVLYTRRPRLLHYTSCVSGRLVHLRYQDEWHDAGNQLYISPALRDAEEVFASYRGPTLLEEEQYDVTKSLERLLCARDAIAHELGLASPPPVVVTANAKTVNNTARFLSLDSIAAGEFFCNLNEGDGSTPYACLLKSCMHSMPHTTRIAPARELVRKKSHDSLTN